MVVLFCPRSFVYVFRDFTRRLDRKVFWMLNKAIEETAITYLPTQQIVNLLMYTGCVRCIDSLWMWRCSLLPCTQLKDPAHPNERPILVSITVNFRGDQSSSVLENQMQIWSTNFGVWPVTSHWLLPGKYNIPSAIRLHRTSPKHDQESLREDLAVEYSRCYSFLVT